MTTLLARLKPYDPRRGHVLRRFTYAGIKFDELRGWYRVEPEVADYLRAVRQRPIDPHTPLAFDVCTDDEAKALDVRDKEAANPRKTATDDIQLSSARVDAAVMPPRRAATDDVPPPPARVEAAVTPSRRVATDEPPPLPARGDGVVTAPRRMATDDVPASPARAGAVATSGPPEPAKDDRKPAPAADTSEPVKDDKRPVPPPATRKDRP